MAISKTPIEKPRKFEVVYKDEDGSESIWKYDLDKFPNGPISVEQKYSAEYLKNYKEKTELNKNNAFGEPIWIWKKP